VCWQELSRQQPTHGWVTRRTVVPPRLMLLIRHQSLQTHQKTTMQAPMSSLHQVTDRFGMCQRIPFSTTQLHVDTYWAPCHRQLVLHEPGPHTALPVGKGAWPSNAVAPPAYLGLCMSLAHTIAHTCRPYVAATDSAAATDVKADPDAKPAAPATQPPASVEPPPAAPPENSFSSFLSPAASTSTRIGVQDALCKVWQCQGSG